MVDRRLSIGGFCRGTDLLLERRRGACGADMEYPNLSVLVDRTDRYEGSEGSQKLLA